MASPVLRKIRLAVVPEGLSTAGIEALTDGFALDWYFNQHAHKNPAHHDFFLKSNPQIRPNPLVLDVMMDYLKGMAN